MPGGDGQYLASYFRNDDHWLYLATSPDGKSFRPLGKVSAPSGVGSLAGGIRDPCILRSGNAWHVAATGGPSANGFVVFSGPTLRTIDYVANPVGPATWKYTWAPSWFVDANGDVYIILAASTTGIGGPFSLYSMKATNAALTTFADPVAIAGPWTTIIDADITRIGSAFHLFGKFEDANPANQKIHHYTAASLAGPYTDTGAVLGDPGGYSEAPWLLPLGGSSYRVYYDIYNKGGVCGYNDSTDGMSTWGAEQYVDNPDPMRHANVVDARAVTTMLSEGEELRMAARPSPKRYLATARLTSAAADTGFIVYTGQTPNLQVPNSAYTLVPWNHYLDPYYVSSNVADAMRVWDATVQSGNPATITASNHAFVAPFDGTYEFCGQVAWWLNAAGDWVTPGPSYWKAALYVNGAIKYETLVRSGAYDMDQYCQKIHKTLKLGKGDKVDVRVWHNYTRNGAATARSIDGQQGFNQKYCWLDVSWVT